MSRTRWWTAVGIVGVLALAAGWMIWRDRSTPGPTTTLLASPTTTTSVAITTTTAAATTTTSEDARIAEVEQILTDLWFGWFDAIYRKDADALWDVVATTSTHESGVREPWTSLEFVQAPSPENISITIDDVLLDRPDCLVVVNTVSVLSFAEHLRTPQLRSSGQIRIRVAICNLLGPSGRFVASGLR